MRHSPTTTHRRMLTLIALLIVVAAQAPAFILAAPTHAQTGPSVPVGYDTIVLSYDPSLVAGVTVENVPENSDPETPIFFNTYEHVEFQVSANGTEGIAGAVSVYPLLTSGSFIDIIPDELGKLMDLTTARPDLFLVSPADLPEAPPINATRDLTAHAKYLETENGAGLGLRYLARWTQDFVPVRPDEITYVYQGMSASGDYWIDARFAVRALLEAPPAPDQGSLAFEAYVDAVVGYNEDMILRIQQLAPEQFTPRLADIDAMIATLTTQGAGVPAGAPARPTPGTNDPQFAYVRDNSIWLHNSQTGAETELVTNSQAHDLAWSYDGRYLLYQDGEVASDSDLPTFDGIWTGLSNAGALSFLHAPTAKLYILDLDEATPRPRLLAQSGCCAAWAPDRLAVAYYAPEQMTIHIVDIDGQELQQFVGATDGVQWLGPVGRMVWTDESPQKLIMITEQMWVNSGAVTMASYPALLGVISKVMNVTAEKGWVETTPMKLQELSLADGSVREIPTPFWDYGMAEGDLAISPDGQTLAVSQADMCAPGPCEPMTALITRQGQVIAEQMFGKHYSFFENTHALAELGSDGQVGVVNIETGRTTEMVFGAYPASRPPRLGAPDIPTPAPSPSAPPPLAVDANQARQWLDEKAALIRSLEKVDISTQVFSIPELNAYDEDAARALVAQIEGELARGELTPTQLDAFARLTIQERSFANMLPAYATVSATLADTASDTIMTGLGLYSAMHPLWTNCANATPLCGVIQEKAERLLLKLVSDSGNLFITGIVNDPEQRTANASAWDVTMRVVSQKLGDGEPLVQLAISEGIRSGMTIIMLRPYLDRGQAWLEKGVQSADLTNGTGDRLSFTGTTQRAEMLTEELQQLATWEAEAAYTRQQDFKQASNIAQLAADIADLATLSPAAALAQIVAIGARAEEVIIVKLPLALLNFANLDCIAYLNAQAAEAAFDAQRPGTSCATRDETMAPIAPRTQMISYPVAHVKTYMPRFLRQEGADYRAALDALVAAVQAADASQIEAALTRFGTTEQALSEELSSARLGYLRQAQLPQAGQALLDSMASFTSDNFLIYVSLAETLLAQKEGVRPQTVLADVAATATKRLTAVQQSADELSKSPGAPAASLTSPDLAIISATAKPADAALTLRVSLTNLGGAAATNVRVLVANEQDTGQTLKEIPAVAPGERVVVEGRLPWPTSQVLRLQVVVGEQLVDSTLVSIPARPDNPAAAAVVSSTPEQPTPQPTKGAKPCGGVFGVIVLPLGAILLARRGRRSPSAAKKRDVEH